MDEKYIIIRHTGDECKLNEAVKQGWLIDRITGPFEPWKGMSNYTVWLKRKEEEDARR